MGLLIGIVLVFGLGCEGEKAKPLSDADVVRLKKISSVMSDNMNALVLADRNTLHPAFSEKAQKLSAQVEKACKNINFRDYQPIFDRTNEQSYQVNGGDCPINVSHRYEFSTAAQTLEIYESFSARSTDYAAESELIRREMKGSLTRSVSSGKVVVRGDFASQDPIEVVGLGKYTVGTAVLQESQTNGSSGGGLVSMRVEGDGGFRVEATIRWRLPGGVAEYGVNGYEYTRKEFQEMFSGFKLIELMDYSINMR